MLDLTPLLPAVRQAVQLSRRVRAEMTGFSSKAANDPVTIADYGAQVVLLRAISAHFPEDAVLAEEGSEQFVQLVPAPLRARIAALVSEIVGEPTDESALLDWLDYGRGRTGRRLWTVDPIDGTRGFVSGRRYSVAIGLLEDRRPSAGILACPTYPTPDEEGLLFYTARGSAWAEPLAGGAARGIHVSECDAPEAMRTVISTDAIAIDTALVTPLYREARISPQPVEYVDGQDKYAMIACGDVDCYVRPVRPDDRPHYIWDHAAGVALVEAAGGVVTDLEGAALDFTQGTRLSKQGIIAASAQAHRCVLDAARLTLS